MARQDLTLRMYQDILAINHAHYGLWEPGEALTLDSLRNAMKRYSKKLIQKIPDNVKSVLDVGAGWGGNALELKASGYDVVALSPDKLQKDHFEGLSSGIPFVLCEYEACEPSRKFDLILMSESCQYINLTQGAIKNRELLNPGGYVLVADYFVKPVTSSSIVRRWGHSLDDYLKSMYENGFVLKSEEDITEQVMPTLELAQQMYSDVIWPVFRFLFGTFEQRYPKSHKFFLWLVRKVTQDGIEKMLLTDDQDSKKIVDVEEFRKNKQYMIFLFQKSAE